MRYRAIRQTISVFCFLLTLAGLGPAQTFAQHPDGEPVPARAGESIRWRAIGPGVGGANFALAFHAHDPRIMLAGTDMGSLFRTADGGQTWTIVGCSEENPGYRGAWNAVFDPKRPEIAWAASEHGVSKSEDAGVTWKRMTAAIGGTPLAFQGIALDPTDTDIVYICQGWAPRGTKGWSRGRVWKSTDGGHHWRELPRPGGPLDSDATPGRNYTGMAVDPRSPCEPDRGHARVYVFGQGGLFGSQDAGDSWQSLTGGLPSSPVNDLVLVDNRGRTEVFVSLAPRRSDAAGTDWVGGVYRSRDDGRTWKPSHQGIETALATVARYKREDFALLLAHSPSAPQRIFAGCVVGVFRSDDLGQAWRQVTHTNQQWLETTDWDGAPRHYNLPRHGGNFLKSYYNGIDHFVLLRAAPGNADHVAFTDNQTTHLSTNGGDTWEDVLFDFAEPFDDGRFGDRPPSRFTHRTANRGAQVIVPLDVAVDPFDPQTLFVAYMDLSLRISRDGGETWEYPTRNILARGRGHGEAQSVVMDPAVRGRAWVAFGSREGRVYLTEDGGRIFRPVGIQPLLAKAESKAERPGTTDPFRINQLVLDPQSPASRRTLYAASDLGVFKTEDGGETWADRSQGLPADLGVVHLAVNSKTPRILYAGHSHRDTAPDAGLYRSMDGGQSWARLAPEQLGALRSLSLCACVPDVLYAVASAPGAPGGYGTPSRLWRSNDRGETWKQLDGRLGSAVAVHPNDPEYVIYATFATDLNAQTPAIWRSLDGGVSWQHVARDIPLAQIRRISFDASDPQRLFAMTSFCVYEGRDAGAPTAPVVRELETRP
jgi:photosystem II stability/assembly factor-like uncharacterized protein